MPIPVAPGSLLLRPSALTAVSVHHPRVPLTGLATLCLGAPVPFGGVWSKSFLKPEFHSLLQSLP